MAATVLARPLSALLGLETFFTGSLASIFFTAAAGASFSWDFVLEAAALAAR